MAHITGAERTAQRKRKTITRSTTGVFNHHSISSLKPRHNAQANSGPHGQHASCFNFFVFQIFAVVRRQLFCQSRIAYSRTSPAAHILSSQRARNSSTSFATKIQQPVQKAPSLLVINLVRVASCRSQNTRLKQRSTNY